MSSLVVACSLFRSKFGDLFGGGNVARFFDNFEQQHDCDNNEFCQLFEIAGKFDVESFA